MPTDSKAPYYHEVGSSLLDPQIQYISNKNTSRLFWYINNIILEFVWGGKGPGIGNTIVKKNEVGGLMSPDFETYYNVAVIKTV